MGTWINGASVDRAKPQHLPPVTPTPKPAQPRMGVQETIRREVQHQEEEKQRGLASGFLDKFLRLFADMWRSDRVFELTEWHSAFVFDFCRRRVVMNEKNLTPNGRGHVFAQCSLKKWLDHLKGQRKVLGFSPERNA